ncbi:MAG TPA: glycosyl hydrolase 108 family protein [Candidatus Competibacter sp.]|nr:hypothetical protein [Candidatus Competibacteraceae bacterium]HAO33203.1 hypothetical protein [Candidatus Competibacteraceae bacterium]HUM93283.1 glycosyl hydrolase 108 family protein [Candidatus Competibacter sp.]
MTANNSSRPGQSRRAVADIISEIIEKEGRIYTDHPSDRGGPTKYGITLETLENYRNRPTTAGDVKALAEDEARKIYFERYVSKPGFDQIVPVSEAVAVEVVDSGVMSGPMRSALWLQQALNALNAQGRLYPDLVEDGRAGPATLAALRAYLKARGKGGEAVLVRAMNVLQGAFLLDISRSRKANEDFTYGWLANRVTV